LTSLLALADQGLRFPSALAHIYARARLALG
jgi:hypothetical protein